MTHVFYRNVHQNYPRISHGRGVYLWDTDGKQYFDASSGAMVANLGHGRSDIASLVKEQVEQVAFAHTMRFTSEALEAFGEQVNQILGGAGWYTYPVSGGSEAIETAIKLSRQVQAERGYPNKYRILTRKASYHGNTLGALSASGHVSRRKPYLPLLTDAIVHVAAPRQSCPGLVDGQCDCIRPFLEAIESNKSDTIAAMIVEPVGGSARSGFVPHAGYLKALRKIADDYDILLIFDEVMTGFGRTGMTLGGDYDEVRPDLITAAKGLSGGYAPLGAVIANQVIYDTIANGSGRFIHGFTYSGNPVSARVGEKVMRILQIEGIVENSATEGRFLRNRLEELQQTFEWIKTVRGLGLMQGIVLSPEPGLAELVVETAWREGCILYLGSGETEGQDGEHLLVAPPLIINRQECEELISRLNHIFLMVDSMLNRREVVR